MSGGFSGGFSEAAKEVTHVGGDTGQSDGESGGSGGSGGYGSSAETEGVGMASEIDQATWESNSDAQRVEIADRADWGEELMAEAPGNGEEGNYERLDSAPTESSHDHDDSAADTGERAAASDAAQQAAAAEAAQQAAVADAVSEEGNYERLDSAPAESSRDYDDAAADAAQQAAAADAAQQAAAADAAQQAAAAEAAQQAAAAEAAQQAAAADAAQQATAADVASKDGNYERLDSAPAESSRDHDDGAAATPQQTPSIERQVPLEAVETLPAEPSESTGMGTESAAEDEGRVETQRAELLGRKIGSVELAHVLAPEFSPNRYGEMNLKGLHHIEGHQNLDNGRVADLLRGPNELGVYEAVVEAKNPANGQVYQKHSTMFPDRFSSADVASAIANAQDHARPSNDGWLVGPSGHGFDIKYKQRTAFPVYL